MKTYQEIKDEVAKELYDSTFIQSLNFLPEKHAIEMMDKVAKRYAEEALKEAAEKVTLTISHKGKILATKQLGWIAEDGDHSEVNKQSILNIIKELK